MFWYMPFLSTTITSSHTSHCVVSKTKSSALLQSSDYHTLEHDWNTSGKGSKIPYGKGSNKKKRENNSAMEELCDNQGAQCHSIKLMNEYCEDLPLWPSDDAFLNDVMSRLTTRLQKSLRALARRFNAHFSWDTGWDDSEREVRHCRHMKSAFRRLKDELGPEWKVTMSLWECSEDVQHKVELDM